MENLLSIDYSLELTEGTHDFISVDARISGSPISNPDIWTPIESIEFSTKELIKTLQAQNNIPKKIISELLSLSAEKMFYQIHDWIFEESVQSFDAHSFLAIPDGPEPFLSTIGFIVFDAETRKGSAVFKNKARGITHFKVNFVNYIDEWKKFNFILKKLVFYKNLENFQRYESEKPLGCFLDMILGDDFIMNDNTQSSIKKVRNFFIENNLLESSNSENEHGTKRINLNIFGWNLLKAIPASWSKSKRFMAGNPDISLLKEKLTQLKEKSQEFNS